MIYLPLASIHHHLALILCIITALVPVSLCFDINEDNDYTLWRNSDANTYDNFVYIGLNEDQKDAQVAIHWSLIGDDEKSIQVCLVAEAKGWLAFGLAKSGGNISFWVLCTIILFGFMLFVEHCGIYLFIHLLI